MSVLEIDLTRFEEPAERAAIAVGLAHVTEIEQSGGGTHRFVLFDDAEILHRHHVPGERNHPRAERHVAIVEWCQLDRFGCFVLSHANSFQTHKGTP